MVMVNKEPQISCAHAHPLCVIKVKRTIKKKEKKIMKKKKIPKVN
jgi:hypothetical protein